jgi:hypothetical protein
MRTAVLLLALVAAHTVAAGSSYVSALPAGKVKVDVMKAVAAPRAAELTEKLRSAIERDREQWRSDAEKIEAAERRVMEKPEGLTREEHAELQRLRSETTLVKTGEAYVNFVRMPDGRLALQPDASLPDLAGVIIDPIHDAVDTPFGRATQPSEITSGSDSRGTGAWTGVEWTLDNTAEDPLLGSVVKFAIGQMNDNGRVILRYNAKQITNDGIPQRASAIIVLPR